MSGAATWLNDLSGTPDLLLAEDILLAPMTSMRVGGPADMLATPETAEAALRLMTYTRENNIPLSIVGGGTNLVISDLGLRGIVLDLGGAFSFIKEASGESGTLLTVGAACPTTKLVRRCAVKGWSGAEVLAGIPGSVGGALIMNAGGHKGDISLITKRIQLISEGKIYWIDAEDAGFAYRKSTFPKDALILACEIQVKNAISEDLINLVREAKEKRSQSQPLRFANAGSIFKNPPNDFAGRLIESAGCKGWRVGRAMVSELHANFIINEGGASADDIYGLMRRVQKEVADFSGINLEAEVRFLGQFPEGR